MSKVFDYLVIGAGSGGIASARRAAKYGAKVAIIENDRWGGIVVISVTGTCVNRGCVPKKIMWNAATIAETLSEAREYGFNVEQKGAFAWAAIKQKRDGLTYILRLNGIYNNNLAKDTIVQVTGTASFVDNKTVRVGTDLYTAKHILIATGSRAWIPNVPGAREFGITSDGFFELEHMPNKVAIAGAGYIAVELAGIFHALGADVTLFIRSNSFLRSFDEIIQKTVFNEYKNIGMKIVECSQISRVENTAASGKNLKLTVAHESGSEQVLDGFHELIYAVGREANVEPLNLANTGVKLTKEGHIVVNEWQDTDVEGIILVTAGIHALGDVCGVAQLTPVAIAAGRKLSDRLFGGVADAKLDYSNIPSVVFSHPACGSVGLTEKEAIEKYGADKVQVHSEDFVNMYYSMTTHKQRTAYKVVCLLPEEKVIGLHLAGRASDEILQGFAVAIKMGATRKDFESCVAIHPVAAEEIVTIF